MTVQATDPRRGWFRFLHHDRPLSWSDNVDERLAYIQANKPLGEVAGRLAAIVRIPDEALPPWFHEACWASNEAGRAYNKACRAYNEARWASNEAWRAYNEAGRVYNEAGRASNEAGRAYDEACRAYNEAWRASNEAGRAYNEVCRASNEAGRAYNEVYNTVDFVLQFGPLPDGVTWNGKELVFQ